MPFEVGAETNQSGRLYRLVEDGPELVLQVFQDDGWTDIYGFIPEPVPFINVEVSNWYTATHPTSSMVRALWSVAAARIAVYLCSSMRKPSWWSARSAERQKSSR